jgi:uncharacterized membrane-anchored protein YitT (DUF2179 family)
MNQTFSSAPRRLREAFRMHIQKHGWRRILGDYLLITLGALMNAVAYNLFYIPNDVVSGGVSGLGIIAYHLFELPVGAVTLVLNAPLFLAGLAWGGGITTGIRTIFAVTVMSAGIDFLAPHLPAVTDNPLLYITYGGLLDGAGLALVLRGQGTTGGTDIVAQLLRRFVGLEISRGMFISNTVIIGIAALVFGMERAMYGVMVAAVSAWAVDIVLAGGRQARQMFIISTAWEAVRDELLHELERGVTLLAGKGGYTGSERMILMCVISPREVAFARRLVKEIDPDAFVIVGNTTEVWGEGFTPIHHDAI